MDAFDEEFEFALEMIILNRNEFGATLSEIRDDFELYFDINCEAVWGYKCLEQHFKPMLSNVMLDIRSKTLDGGCVLYYMDVDAAISKLSCNLSDAMIQILYELDIDLDKLKKIRDSASISSSSTNISSQSDSPRPRPKSARNITEDCILDGHVLIGDNFFLEMARIDLCRQHAKNRVQRIGHCISGQSIKRAVNNISGTVHTIHQSAAIINLGAVDLLQGREVIDMMEDMFRLGQLLSDRDIFPLVTTVPPLANKMHDKNLESKRKLFNEFLMRRFDCVDIECGFFSNCQQLLFNQYQSDARKVGGTKCPLVLWSNVARQRVLNTLRRKIPQIYGEMMGL